MVLSLCIVSGMETSALLRSADEAHECTQRIVMPVDDALLERNDRVVGNGDVFGTHLRAALRDVAVADAEVVLQVRGSIGDVERMHFQRRRINEEARANELLVLVVV